MEFILERMRIIVIKLHILLASKCQGVKSTPLNPTIHFLQTISILKQLSSS